MGRRARACHGDSGGASCSRRNRHPGRRRVHTLRVASADHLDRRVGEHPLHMARDAWSSHCAAPRRAHAAHHVREGCEPRTTRVAGRPRHVPGDGVSAAARRAGVRALSGRPRRRHANAGDQRGLPHGCCRRGHGADATHGDRAAVRAGALETDPRDGQHRRRGWSCVVAAVADAAAAGQREPDHFFRRDARRSASSSVCPSRSRSALRRCRISRSRRQRRCRSCRAGCRKACRT